MLWLRRTDWFGRVADDWMVWAIKGRTFACVAQQHQIIIFWEGWPQGNRLKIDIHRWSLSHPFRFKFDAVLQMHIQVIMQSLVWHQKVTCNVSDRASVTMTLRIIWWVTFSLGYMAGITSLAEHGTWHRLAFWDFSFPSHLIFYCVYI